MKKIFFLLLACSVLIGCGGKKEVKQVNQESKTATEAFGVAEAIKIGFIKKDTAAIQKHTTETGFRSITANKKPYDSVEIAFTPRWVEIDGDKMLVNISWKSSWLSAGKKSEERGMAIFVMQGSPLRVTDILRANPFIFPNQ